MIGYDHEQVPYWRTVLGRCRQVGGQVAARRPRLAWPCRVAVPLTTLLLTVGLPRQVTLLCLRRGCRAVCLVRLQCQVRILWYLVVRAALGCANGAERVRVLYWKTRGGCALPCWCHQMPPPLTVLLSGGCPGPRFLCRLLVVSESDGVRSLLRAAGHFGALFPPAGAG